MKYNTGLILIFVIAICFFSAGCSKKEEVKSSNSKLTLGNKAQISVSVSNLKISLPYYRKLGFRKIEARDTGKNPWALISDGTIFIMLSQNKFPSPALTYFAADMEGRVDRMKQLGITFSDIATKKGKFVSAVLRDPNGLGITLIRFDANDLPNSQDTSYTKLGKFGEFSIPTNNLENSLLFWKTVGFSIEHRSQQPYPWAVLTDGQMTLGIHETDEYDAPVITYYSQDSARRIAQLKSDGIVFQKEFADENGQINNAILHAPDNQLFFIFKGEI
ncbi:MAG: hypothetical protein P8184_21340 [Calditrichia bacterium]